MFETTRIEQLVKGVNYRFWVYDHNHSLVRWALGQEEDSDTCYSTCYSTCSRTDSIAQALEWYNRSLKAGWKPTKALSLLAEDVQRVRMDLPINTAYQSEIDFLLSLENIIGAEIIKESNEQDEAAFKKTDRIEAAAHALAAGKVVRVKKEDLGSKVGTELQRLKESIEEWLFVSNNNPDHEVQEKWRVSIAPSRGDYLLRARRV